MTYFGREPERRPTDGAALGERLAADPSLMQLLPVSVLRTEAAAVCLPLGGARGKVDQARLHIRQALIFQEIGRRTGEVETLGRAASAATRARELAKGERKVLAEALLQHAQILGVAGATFCDAEASETASARLDEIPAQSLDPVGSARAAALRAGLAARRALRTPNSSAYKNAAQELRTAAKVLDQLAQLGRVDHCEAQDVRCDLGELMIAAANHTKDRAKLDEALEVLALASSRVDQDFRPLTWTRIEVLRGQALAALGDLGGAPELIAEGSAVLKRVLELISVADSPLEVAKAGHTLGLVMQALGEACDEDEIFDKAAAAFGAALAALEGVPQLPYRAILGHDAAACMARRAERRGDLGSLERAEAIFRESLKTGGAASDPLAWAVTQVALARIYEAEAEIRGDNGEHRDAAFALASALEIFGELGLRSLSDAALNALARIKSLA